MHMPDVQNNKTFFFLHEFEKIFLEIKCMPLCVFVCHLCVYKYSMCESIPDTFLCACCLFMCFQTIVIIKPSIYLMLYKYSFESS